VDKVALAFCLRHVGHDHRCFQLRRVAREVRALHGDDVVPVFVLRRRRFERHRQRSGDLPVVHAIVVQIIDVARYSGNRTDGRLVDRIGCDDRDLHRRPVGARTGGGGVTPTTSGAMVSRTVTSNVSLLVSPARSVAVQLTAVVPSENILPLAGTQTTGTFPSTRSAAVAVKERMAPVGPVASTT
jgi:hypothetical protein